MTPTTTTKYKLDTSSGCVDPNPARLPTGPLASRLGFPDGDASSGEDAVGVDPPPDNDPPGEPEEGDAAPAAPDVSAGEPDAGGAATDPESPLPLDPTDPDDPAVPPLPLPESAADPLIWAVVEPTIMVTVPENFPTWGMANGMANGTVTCSAGASTFPGNC
jgi:hypothetical protein